MHPLEVTSPERWSELLRQAGLRVTSGRLAALTHIEAHPHSSVAQIHAALARDLPSLSTQSVHNITHDLTAHGILNRIDTPDSGSALYETRTADNHHHVQCIVCHRIEDVDCVVGEAPCLTPHDAHGMRVLEATVTFRGVCAECDSGLLAFPPSNTLPQRKDQHV
ncbi:Fur family transcriptional regulator [Leucobacter sp. W1153]|uniref:Fur family transcriptional regulator n=1 Tax=Leucobacter sp. W1153 TaxID=3439064 RepID=UPI003F3AE515